MDPYKKGEGMEEDEEEMMGGPGMEHGWGGMGMMPGMGWLHGKRCGCPWCLMMKAWRKLAMMGGGMMRMGMGMMPWMMPGMGGPGMHAGAPGMGMGGPGMHGGMGGPMMGDMPPWRRFVSSEEKIKGLEAYLRQLQMEEKAVREKIAHLRSKAEAAPE